MISRNVTIAFSAEMAGVDGKHMLDIKNLQESNGSVGVSPSATAYFATYIKRGDEASLKYLRSVKKPDGGMPNVAPFDIFEIAWTLWNLSFIPGLKKNRKLKPYLDFLSKAWQPKRGVGFAAGYSVKDSDDTGLVYDTLLRFGSKKIGKCVNIRREGPLQMLRSGGESIHQCKYPCAGRARAGWFGSKEFICAESAPLSAKDEGAECILAG